MKKRTKTVKAWVAVNFFGTKMHYEFKYPMIFVQKSRPKARDWHGAGKIRFVPCTITYSLPIKTKRK